MWNRLTHHGGPANNKAPLLPSRKQSNIVPRVTNGTTSNESAGRPYLGDTRGSTISLLSNSSDVSLIGNGVRPRTESNLRHTLNSSPPPDVPDPVLVLSEIIRSNAGEETPMVRRAFDEVSDVNRDDIDTFIKFGESSLEDYINDSRGDEPRLTASRSFGLPAGSSEQCG